MPVAEVEAGAARGQIVTRAGPLGSERLVFGRASKRSCRRRLVRNVPKVTIVTMYSRNSNHVDSRATAVWKPLRPSETPAREATRGGGDPGPAHDPCAALRHRRAERSPARRTVHAQARHRLARRGGAHNACPNKIRLSPEITKPRSRAPPRVRGVGQRTPSASGRSALTAPPVVLAQDDATRIEVGDAASEVVVGGPSKNRASSQPSTPMTRTRARSHQRPEPLPRSTRERRSWRARVAVYYPP